MKKTKLEIQGFRGIRSGEIAFGDFSVLIGANNCGKTTVIEALALLFGRDRLVCRMHGAGGGAPRGAGHGNYRHGGRTKEAVDARKMVNALVRLVRETMGEV